MVDIGVILQRIRGKIGSLWNERELAADQTALPFKEKTKAVVNLIHAVGFPTAGARKLILVGDEEASAVRAKIVGTLPPVSLIADDYPLVMITYPATDADLLVTGRIDAIFLDGTGLLNDVMLSSYQRYQNGGVTEFLQYGENAVNVAPGVWRKMDEQEFNALVPLSMRTYPITERVLKIVAPLQKGDEVRLYVLRGSGVE